MPIYNYKCKCGKELQRILKNNEVADKLKIECECGSTMSRNPSSVSMSSMETLDNGIMPRSVTRYTDAEDVTKQLVEAEKKMRQAE
jgi:hypothetical protein